MVGVEEIEKSEFNLNIPRYIDSRQAVDIQDIEGHLKGGIPGADVDALQSYWDVCPQLRQNPVQSQSPRFGDKKEAELGLAAIQNFDGPVHQGPVRMS